MIASGFSKINLNDSKYALMYIAVFREIVDSVVANTGAPVLAIMAFGYGPWLPKYDYTT